MGGPPAAVVSEDLLDVALEAAWAAAAVLVDRFAAAGGPEGVEAKSTPTDLVSAADREAERAVLDVLGRRRPDDGILGEEGADVAGTTGLRWVVDPLDGTVNYLYGLPDWAVSIAAEVGGVIVAGAVSVPLRRSLFTAVRGGGAWLESAWQPGRRQLACNSAVALSAALIATGFGYGARQRAGQGRVVASVLPRPASGVVSTVTPLTEPLPATLT